MHTILDIIMDVQLYTVKCSVYMMNACAFIRYTVLWHCINFYLSGRPLRPVLKLSISGATTLSFTWTHNNVCFSECMYNISWWDPFENETVNGTNYTIDGLQPGRNYSVTICAVCEAAQSCTEPQQYRTGEMHAAACIPCQWMIL